MSTSAVQEFDVARIRLDFPILAQKIHGHPLVYLDNAASSQKPSAVIEAIVSLYENDYSNIHRGVHTLSERSTAAHDRARLIVQRFIGARDSREIIFVRGATEGINLVAGTFGRKEIGKGDEIIISTMEHHSNIVPWQLLCEERGAILRVVPIDDNGDLEMKQFLALLGERTKLVSIVHVSNALGTINPVSEIIEAAHAIGVPVLLDGAQAVPHMAVDVVELDCDFYVFSGHKAFGPSGIGVLYGKQALLERMPPYMGGGDMIRTVSFEKTTFNDLPFKFEAGTPDIAGAIGLGAALEYLMKIGMDQISVHEQGLLEYATAEVSQIPGVQIVGRATEKAGVLSFTMEGVHPHDIGTILDQQGVAIRAGHHCAQPVMDRFGIPATARASFAFYNTRDEIDRLVAAVRRVQEMFS